MLTLDNLKRRGRALANRHFLFGEEEETVDHLLVHYSQVRIIWDLLLAIVSVSWVFPLWVRKGKKLGGLLRLAFFRKKLLCV